MSGLGSAAAWRQRARRIRARLRTGARDTAPPDADGRGLMDGVGAPMPGFWRAVTGGRQALVSGVGRGPVDGGAASASGARRGSSDGEAEPEPGVSAGGPVDGAGAAVPGAGRVPDGGSAAPEPGGRRAVTGGPKGPVFGAGPNSPSPSQGWRGRDGERARGRRRAWAELLRLPALFTVPGDALTGAAAAGARPGARTLLAIGSSVCLYEAGMALNDWADREEDAAERPHRPLPSGRIRPAAALTAAGALTVAGLGLAARAGRPALGVAVPLAATVWAYDLTLKHTPAGPVAMAGARALDLLLGAAATTGRTRPALPSAALLGTHTLAVTTVSRRETQGGSSLAPVAALAATGLLTYFLTRRPGTAAAAAPASGTPAEGTTASRSAPAAPGTPARPVVSPAGARPLAARAVGEFPPAAGLAQRWLTSADPSRRRASVAPARPRALRSAVAAVGDFRPAACLAQRWPGFADPFRRRAAPARPRALRSAVAAVPDPRLPGRPAGPPLTALASAALYVLATARPCLHAALNPSPPLTQRAVGAGIRATIPLQAGLSARCGAPASALLIAALAPLGARFARRVSVT